MHLSRSFGIALDSLPFRLSDPEVRLIARFGLLFQGCWDLQCVSGIEGTYGAALGFLLDRL